MTLPWLPAASLPDDALRGVRRRAIFDYCKWDPQVQDICTLAPFPFVLREQAWQELSALGEALGAETATAERELAARPQLHRQLGLPRRAMRALRDAANGPPASVARLARFDFHLTSQGWRITEVNSDVPGGLNEASGLARLFAPFAPGTVSAGDPAGAYAAALTDALPPGARIALVHATAYTDDAQVMHYVSRRLEQRGAHSMLVSPAHVQWTDGHAAIERGGGSEPLDAAVRFFPAEWLAELPRRTGWQAWFARAATPLSNPATALLTQSKRFPLVWDELVTQLPTWRALLPETRDPTEVRWEHDATWVLKPALGRIGEDILMAGVTPPAQYAKLARDAQRHPGDWVAQRRFIPVPLETEDGPRYPCVGVYTVDARAVGAYVRIAREPLIDWRAQDAAALIARDCEPVELGSAVGDQRGLLHSVGAR